MGGNWLILFSVAFALTGVGILYFSPETLDPVISFVPIGEENVKKLMSWLGREYKVDDVIESAPHEETTQKAEKLKHRLFTKEELIKYDGGPDSLGLYLAILGDVFDVEKGAQHYKPGGSYSFFAGRDASRAYLTGDFTDETNADDVSDLDGYALSGLVDWLTFYQDEYPLVGHLIGKYYDPSGNPTEERTMVLEKIQEAKSNKWLEDREKEIFPSCNTEFNRDIGARVWCTKKSGGVDRKWVGVPRQYFKAGKDPRCVCVRDSGPPSNDPDAEDHKNIGDLEFPNLEEYPGCPSDAVSCKVENP